MHQMAVGQLPKARYAFVDGMVDLEVLSFQVFVALSPVVEPDGEDPEVVGRAFADQEAIAGNAAGLVNQGRGGRPVGIVEHGVVQRRQDALIHVLTNHGANSLEWERRGGCWGAREEGNEASRAAMTGPAGSRRPRPVPETSG